MKNNKKGFTIVELVIVIAVIAILAAVLIPVFTNVIDKANESAAIQNARNEYTEYIAEGNADNVSDRVSGTFVIEVGAKYFFVVKAGEFDTNPYASKEDTDLLAKIAVENKTATIVTQNPYEANDVKIYKVDYQPANTPDPDPEP